MSEDDARAAERWHDRIFHWYRACFPGDVRTAEEVERHRELSEIVRTFETGHGGVLSLPSLQARVDACPLITCFVVGHAPDCECATL